MTATTTKEDLKKEILTILRDHVGVGQPATFWDILLSLSRYAHPEGKFVKEFNIERGSRPEVRYAKDDVEEALKAFQELLREGHCQLAMKDLMHIGDFDGTRTYAYEFALVLAE